LLLAGCYHPQQIYQFTAPQQPEDPVAIVARAMAASGQAPALVDPQLGIVQSRWGNTGFSWLRYTATVARGPDGAAVSLRADSQFCDQGAFSSDGMNVVGNCRANTLGIAKPEQEQLTALGTQLEHAFGSPVNAAPAPAPAPAPAAPPA
jgi:hypothetical protein